VEVARVTDSRFSWTPATGGPVSLHFPVDDTSRVGEVRRSADLLARGAGLDEQRRGVLSLVVTEAATNLARHGREGHALLRDVTLGGRPGVELLAVDRGPGMQDLSRMFEDGVSTAGTAGQGLGAMRRLADLLDVYSVPGQGTVVLARVLADQRQAPAPAALLDVGVVCLPVEGETACGDGWHVHQDATRAVVLLVDGLGHGPNAAQAADVAIESFRAVVDRAPAEIVASMDAALRATRGAALAVAEITRTATGDRVRFCAVGNTVSAIVGRDKSRSLASMNGTAGLQTGRLQEFTQDWIGDAMLVMHTDGITSRWRLDSYPTILAHDPGIVAAVLQRDATRPRDDATVLVLRRREASVS
jgi:anti-sigma regulatory factor (Ser/Thr protein kinase)